MDLEAMQLLNLSPIPELSEIELSTMLDHLSGLSDINGDLTDRNVEDIIKEAEDLLDKSASSRINELSDVNKTLEAVDKKSVETGNNSLKESEKCSIQESSSSKIKHYENPGSDVATAQNTSNEEDSKHCNTPVENTPTKVYSPGSTGSTNHIKSTIDSLKEFSTLVEKKLSSQSENSTQKHNKKTTQKACENKKVIMVDSPLNEKLVGTKEEIVKPTNLSVKKASSMDKSIKLLNCFERLYQVRPVRWSTTKRPKVIDKTQKTMTKKKLSKDLKNVRKNNRQEKTLLEKTDGEAKNVKICDHLSSFIDEDIVLGTNKAHSKYFLLSDDNCSQIRPAKDKTADEYPTCCSLDERNDYVQPRIDEKLILKVLEEMEEIKDQVRKVGAVTDNPGKKTKDEQPEVGSDNPEAVNSSGIKRLERQFSLLKEKYDYQMEKLETENYRLREALNSRQEKILPMDGVRLPVAKEVIPLENCKVPENSPCISMENIHEAVDVREASSQTEEIKCGRREVGTDAETFAEGRNRTENKENVTGKTRPGRCRPFSDVNQPAGRKKIIEHESQLLATLRGLQAEVTAKDKENRKLKNEIETVRKQMKKMTSRVENYRKCHAGTQTIGLGPIGQKTYNPENYEVPQEFEKENEDLRLRIKALEEDFELLKEKRITDLQALHQVHEEEMAKLVSKLETQSALTRHLHSLLVNR